MDVAVLQGPSPSGPPTIAQTAPRSRPAPLPQWALSAQEAVLKKLLLNHSGTDPSIIYPSFFSLAPRQAEHPAAGSFLEASSSIPGVWPA